MRKGVNEHEGNERENTGPDSEAYQLQISN